MVQSNEGRRGVGGDQLANAEVVIGDVGYFSVVVDGEDVGGDGHGFDDAEVIAHFGSYIVYFPIYYMLSSCK